MIRVADNFQILRFSIQKKTMKTAGICGALTGGRIFSWGERTDEG